ncbi:uncharacterized protein G2W53_003962 [Senna tora]|uniref:Uncharacterized protein n=1 Tax=Senna tora TaxID=362788 RepID=A0A835CGV9_9FABA|nr:uncharacterized protein G2W53_003962 [Senna tora]
MGSMGFAGGIVASLGQGHHQDNYPRSLLPRYSYHF